MQQSLHQGDSDSPSIKSTYSSEGLLKANIKLKKGSGTGVILVFSVAFAAYILSLFDVFQGLEHRVYDMIMQRRGPVTVEGSDVVIVAIDQNTFDSLAFPFDRAYYAKLVQNLKALGAKRIVFDILFTDPGANPASDSIFKAAIAEAGNVVMSGVISLNYQRGIKEPLSTVVPPHPAVSPIGTPWGIVNDFFDPDGVSRRYTLFLTSRDSVFLSLGMKVFSLEKGVSGGDLTYTDRGDLNYAGLQIPRVTDVSSTLLNFYGPSETFSTYSMIDVISESYDLAAMWSAMSEEERGLLAATGMDTLFTSNPFKDKIVLIGASAEELQDNKITPFYTARFQRRTPGVELHANALQMFEDRRFIRPIGIGIVLLGVVLCSIVTYLLGRHITQWSGLLMVIVGFLAIMATGYYLFVELGLWLRQVPMLAAIAIGYPTNLFYRFIHAQREKALYRGMFSQYVQKEVVDEILKHPEKVKLGGEIRRMSALFTDVAGFTTVSEKLTPGELVPLLNEYLSAMSRVIVEKKGTIDKYEGDLIMAEFGAPIWSEDHASLACRAALGMQNKLKELRAKWKSEGRIELYSRVGVNTGDMLVGNMGSDMLFDYTVMGDSVNLASRLEGANKEYGSTIMIGKNTWDDVKDTFITRPLDLLRVKGKLEPVAVHELLAEKPEELPPVKLRVVEIYKEGYALYRTRHFSEGIEKFQEALNLDPDDGPSKVYLHRCALYLEEPPPVEWDGAWTLHEK